jgi:hypothetical protein
MEAGAAVMGWVGSSVAGCGRTEVASEVDRAAWLDAASESGLLGMAATARALAPDDEGFVQRVRMYLYRGRGPEQFDPGPLAREVALSKRAFPKVQLATSNYDQLRALLPVADQQLERLTGLGVVDRNRHPNIVGMPQQPDIDPIADSGVELSDHRPSPFV